MDRIVDTLRELGPGLAFVGRQLHCDVGGDKNGHTVRYSLGRPGCPTP